MNIDNMMTPAEIVSELDKHIVGQKKAKKSVAVALRNRWRRQQVSEPLRHEIQPKNILMIGPTGVGKTEIARRLAKLAKAPFIKVEATKFTEVGYVGRDVDSIIRDLVEISIKQTREIEMEKIRNKAEDAAEERILDVLLPPARDANNEPIRDSANHTRQIFRKRLREGDLDDTEIDIKVASPSRTHMEILAPEGYDFSEQLKGLYDAFNAQQPSSSQKMTVKKAMRLLVEEESNKHLNEEEIREKAVFNAEQKGIVFLDEIDKIANRSNGNSADVSRMGVQRDLLPLVEGTAVKTKYGMIKTDHILFIASGAFHLSKPSDLIPELQGRFPIRVELESLSTQDFVDILNNTDASLTKQYKALLATEQVELEFTQDGIERLAEIAYNVNEQNENIGARRLYTVMEKLLEEISYTAGNTSGEKVLINTQYVNEKLAETASNLDLAQYVL